MVLTVHDVQHLDMPHLFSRAERTYRRIAYDIPARYADGVITISNFSRARIIRMLGLAPSRVHVAYLGHDVDPQSANCEGRGDFLLYPARAWPHKNHQRLFAAVSILRQTRTNLRLVLTGYDQVDQNRLPPWVENRGHVDRAVLLSLYRQAQCLVFPSLYEGFGLPPLEAMASGCPVAVARTGSLPEVCGTAASYFDPWDPHDIARGVEHALGNSTELAARGLDQASRFSWSQCATDHKRAYLSILQEAHRPHLQTGRS
jgi:glycosyltransferase involved in cell wall biosynthesis